MWELNTSFDATRLDTLFYLLHGWDPQNTVLAMLGSPPSGFIQKVSYEWRRKVQRQHEYAQAWAKDLLAEAKSKRSEAQTRIWMELSERPKKGFEVGDAVWLYLGRVQPGLTKKFAHLWHGPFRITEVTNDYRFEVAEEDDLDAALLPEDVIEPDEDRDVYEVEAIQDIRWVKRTRTSRRLREYLVKWKGYSDPEWFPVSQLNCGALLYGFNKCARAQSRFRVMQSGDDPLSLALNRVSSKKE
ncbi:unnamed protein product [Phytophthora fragariaefolia]|uniref:Unnamed protein product n=1 Tax=Phytophthora fragariaefolia TaxID=1490495 RepID=A0A9W6YD64_9STRA|nr:unnamed protein product [Phytophthora fragariaefolia]